MGGVRGANPVLVANDEVAEDPVQQNLMEMVLAEGSPCVSGHCKSDRQHSSRR